MVIFAYGYGNKSSAHECLDNCRIRGTYVLGHLSTPVTILKLLTSLNSNPDTWNLKKRAFAIIDDYHEDDFYEDNSCTHSQGCDLPAGYLGDQFSCLLRIWGSCFGTYSTDLEVKRYLTHTVNRSIGALQELLEISKGPSLAHILLDNHIALDYLLVAQWIICASVNISSCTWIDTSSRLNLKPVNYTCQNS